MCNFIIETMALVIVIGASFFIGWLIAVVGIINENAFNILNNETYSNTIKRLWRMLKTHVSIFIRRLTW